MGRASSGNFKSAMKLDESGLRPEGTRARELAIADDIYKSMRQIGLPEFARLEFDVEFKGKSFKHLGQLRELLISRFGYAVNEPRWSWFSRRMAGKSAPILVDEESIRVWVAEMVNHTHAFRCSFGDWGTMLDLPQVRVYETGHSTAADRFQAGVAACDAGLMTAAFCYFREATLEDPVFAAGFDAMGSVQLQFWLLTDAMKNCDKAVELAPEEASFRLNRGAARDYLGDSKGAMADYDFIIALLPGCSKAFLNRGNTRWSSGDKLGAFADWRQARDLGCDLAESYLRRFATT